MQLNLILHHKINSEIYWKGIKIIYERARLLLIILINYQRVKHKNYKTFQINGHRLCWWSQFNWPNWIKICFNELFLLRNLVCTTKSNSFSFLISQRVCSNEKLRFDKRNFRSLYAPKNRIKKYFSFQNNTSTVKCTREGPHNS